MPYPAVSLIEELCIDTIQLPHAKGKVAVRCLDEEMVMVGHEAVGVADPIVAFIDVLGGYSGSSGGPCHLENRLLLVPAGGHMIDCAGVFYAKRTGHRGTIAENWQNGTIGSQIG